jgi:hypothetical protein
MASSGRDDELRLLSAPALDPGTGGSSPQESPRRPDQIGPDPGYVTPPAQGERPCVEVVLWDAWYTQADERVCPECGPLHGQWFRQGEGPQPPLHADCRCFRQFVREECVTRRGGGAGSGENY